MIKIVIPLGLILLVGGLCGFLTGAEQQKYKPSENQPVMKTCTTQECFQQSILSGAPAEYDLNEQGASMHMEIRGKSDLGDTIAYIRLDEIDESQIPEEYRLIAGSIKGADMVCALSDDNVQKMMAGEIDESILDKCDGTLKSFVQIAVSASQK